MSLFPFMMMLCLGAGSEESGSVAPLPYIHWESNSVQSNGIRLHYWRTGGKDKPALVLSHGITDYGLNWATLASKFERDYDIIMVDARGHGFSEKPEGPYDLATHVEDLVGLIKGLKLKKPILMGHSMGGSIVMLLAATYPDLPRAVIMEDPPIEEALENMTEEMAQGWKNWVKQQATTSKAELMEKARTEFHPGWSDFDYDHWAESKRLVTPQVIDILQGDGFGNPRELLPKVTVPALLLKAEAKAEKHRRRHLEAGALLPNGKLIHIEGAGHVMRKDKPTEIEKEVRAFLKTLGS